ncbi:MAG: hypothetical protein KF850_25555 [Labilithrix sp.]|nr:hypothetical protein [Labilithrix sp.]
MDSSLPVLVSRLPDLRALTRLVRAALRHEVANVALAQAPQRPEAHTLDLHVVGQPPLALLAEPAGPAHDGQFPLRLRPLYRAQAAQLYALLEAHNVSVDGPPDTSPLHTSKPPTPAPDTLDFKHTLAIEPSLVAEAREIAARNAPPVTADASPLTRAMSGSAPPVAVTPAPHATVPRAPAAPAGPQIRRRTDVAPGHDPRRTAPSAVAAIPAAGDLRRTAPSGSMPAAGDLRRAAPSGSMPAAGDLRRAAPSGSMPAAGDPRRAAPSGSMPAAGDPRRTAPSGSMPAAGDPRRAAPSGSMPAAGDPRRTAPSATWGAPHVASRPPRALLRSRTTASRPAAGVPPPDPIGCRP